MKKYLFAMLLCAALVGGSICPSFSSRARTVDRTESVSVFSNPAAIAPADRSTNQNPPGTPSAYPSTIAVSGVVGNITSLSVTLNAITHNFPQDLDVLIVGPTGARSILMSDAVDTQQMNLRTFTFSQAAPIAIPADGGALSGTYRPANYAGSNTIEPGAVDNFPAPGPGSTSYAADLSVFNGTNPNGTWSLYVVDDENLDTGSITQGWSITIDAQAARFDLRPSDFDGDQKSDIGVFRPSDGAWYLIRSATNSFLGLQFGANGDIPTTGDFDGDGKGDITVWRAAAGQPGYFYILRSSDNTFVAQNWGTGGDDPTVCRDYDGDGKTDFAVFRPGAQGAFYVLKSSDNSFSATPWGTAQDVPIPADYDGDGKADVGVYSVNRSSGNSTFYLLLSGSNQFQATPFGIGGVDRVVTGDFDGDRKADLAVWRTSGGDSGAWYYLRSSDNGFVAVGFGSGATDTPAPGDYDGDGKTDLAVFRPGAPSYFFIITSSNNVFAATPFGNTGDIPTTKIMVH